MSEEIISQFPPGTLAVVATPIGNLGDVSYRAVETLKSADVLLCEDTRHSKRLLDRYQIQVATTSYGAHNLKSKLSYVLEQLGQGKRVALISDAGTPGVSDPGTMLVCAAIAAGYVVFTIPGPAALLPALVLSGLRTDRFVFEGFLPHKKGRQTKLKQLANEPRTIVLYESVHRIQKTLSELHEYLGNRRVAVCRELTKLHEEIVRGSLSDAISHFTKHEPRGEFVVVVAGTDDSAPQEEQESSL
ncbi:MAG: 16S rRNA (cytidine(1402)-2'-O)-methyltransferase [Calditrichaeota bacterium]|nr:16S rRNA (cytidine(1402)-2'-O)-methyltransferase [Calditrichota bacterium]MCB9365620.1 16S rRNA (cytidine(1402)-2'-O)-methyltransferase [Calditrichota bacterium]